MNVVLYTADQSCRSGTSQELLQAVEDRGDCVVGTFIDYGAEVPPSKRNAGWKALLASLDGVDQVAVASAADLPGRTVKDLLKLLDHLRDNRVGLFMLAEGIDTGSSPAFTLLDVIRAFRRAKLSTAIKIGQAKAIDAGKTIGRPTIPPGVQARIRMCLRQGGGIRSTARKFNVSPGTVVNIRSISANPDRQAA